MKKQRVLPALNALSKMHQMKLTGGCPNCDTGPEAPNPPPDMPEDDEDPPTL